MECEKGVRWKSSVQMYEINLLRWVCSTQRQLQNRTYKSKGFNEFWIYERGKMRHIQSVHISERSVQKTLCQNALKPIILPKLIYDNSASQKNKGTEFAIKRLKGHLRKHYNKYGRKGGILTLDFKNYFGSIEHEKLLNALRESIKDDELFKITKDFIDVFDGDRGIGLGSEICQICAIYFPNKFDHFIKEKLKIKKNGRYMDDSYLIHQDIDYLKYCLKEIRKAAGKIGLELNEKRTKIFRFEKESFEFLKKIIFISDTGKVVMKITREKITKQRQKLKKQKVLLSNEKMEIEAVRQSYQSWRSYASKYNNYKSIERMDNLFYELFGKEVIWTRKSQKNLRKCKEK